MQCSTQLLQCFEKRRLLYQNMDEMDEMEQFVVVIFGCLGFSCLFCICSACCKQFKSSVDSTVEGGQRDCSEHHYNSSYSPD